MTPPGPWVRLALELGLEVRRRSVERQRALELELELDELGLEGGAWENAGANLTPLELAGVNRGALELRAWVDVDAALELWPLAGLVELETALDDIDRAGPWRARLVGFQVRRRGRHG